MAWIRSLAAPSTFLALVTAPVTAAQSAPASPTAPAASAPPIPPIATSGNPRKDQPPPPPHRQRDPSTYESLLTGTMPRERSICLCQSTLQRPYNFSSIFRALNPRINHTPTSHLIMDQRCNMHQMQTNHDQLTRKREKMSNKL